VTIRRLGLAAAAALSFTGVAPVAACSASTLNTTGLRAAMANPVETDFVESLGQAPGSLIGTFDAKTYAQTSGADATSRGSILQALKDYGFVTGYGREWSKPRLSDRMGELLMVFNSDWGAAATASTSKTSYSKDEHYRLFFDPQVNADAYGVTEDDGGYYWSVVIFTKGNEMFAIERGSATEYPTAQSIAQAQKAFAFAPNSIDAPPPAAVGPGFLPNLRLLAIGVSVLMLLAACAIGVGIFVAFRPLSRGGHPAKPGDAERQL
jgi:hypothetical protein